MQEWKHDTVRNVQFCWAFNSQKCKICETGLYSYSINKSLRNKQYIIYEKVCRWCMCAPKHQETTFVLGFVKNYMYSTWKDEKTVFNSILFWLIKCRTRPRIVWALHNCRFSKVQPRVLNWLPWGKKIRRAYSPVGALRDLRESQTKFHP